MPRACIIGSEVCWGRQVFIDAHILCTPSIADIDGDGHDELVVAASYFFDREYYDDPVRTESQSSLTTAHVCRPAIWST